MTAGADFLDGPMLRAPEGLGIAAGNRTLRIAPFSLSIGDWALLSPGPPGGGADLAEAAARVFASLERPASGEVELFGRGTAGLAYLDLMRTRARLGFVPSYGGLLSNRTLRENVALPLSVHGGLSARAEALKVGAALAEVDLTQVADRRPYDLDGQTRFRACVARALVVGPLLLVIEGLGDFETHEAAGLTWTHLLSRRIAGACAAVVCLPRENRAFERWFRAQGGTVLPCSLPPESEGTMEKRT